MHDYVRSYPFVLQDALRAEWQRAREYAADLAAMRLLRTGLDYGPGNIVVREGLPHADFGLATEAEQWALPALCRGYPLVYLDAPLGLNKVAVFWAAYCHESAAAQEAVTVVRFGQAGVVRFELHVERMYAERPHAVLLPEPAVYLGGDHVHVTVLPRATVAAGEPFGFGVMVAEPRCQRACGNPGEG